MEAQSSSRGGHLESRGVVYGPVRHYHHHDRPGSRTDRHGRRDPGTSMRFGRHIYHAHRRFLTPGILLMLAEEPSHGYALIEKINDFDIAGWEIPAPVIYRTLRYLERDGLAVSDNVETEGRGPSRKVYRLTDGGWEALASWSEQMDEISRLAGEFKKKYRAVSRGSSEEQGRKNVK